MKQKIVIKISMEGSKSRTRAMKIAVCVPGVMSVQLDGDDKIVVTGEGIDSTYLTVKIRKKVGHTDLVSVTPITEGKKEAKKEEKKEEKKEPPSVQHIVWNPHQYGMPQQPYWYEVREHRDEDNCTIM